MKNYDEITASVLQKAAVRTVKLKRIRYACTLSAVCSACVIGGAAFMKLDKPELMPSESQTDTIYSASDPSTDIPAETTETTILSFSKLVFKSRLTTTEPPATTEPTTEPVTTDVTTSAVSQTVSEVMTVYTVVSSAPTTTSITSATHAPVTVIYTTIPHTTAGPQTTARPV